MLTIKEFADEFPELTQPRIAKHFPVELRGLPKVVNLLSDVFKNKNLEIVQHDLKRPGDVENGELKDSGLSKLRSEDRAKIKITGHKLYMAGEGVKQFLSDYFHKRDHLLKPRNIEDIELATSAHPELIKIILHQGIKDKMLPAKTVLKNESNGVSVLIPDDSAKIRITTFRKRLLPDSLSGDNSKRRIGFGGIEDDAIVRGKNDAIYYDLEKKSIMDYGLGIYNLETSPKEGK
jgi:hypothetical protein